MKRTVRFSLNNKKFGSQTTIEGVHVGDDNSCELVITITDGNKVLDITDGSTVVTMSGTKPDGTVISRPCSIVGNTIVYTLNKQDTAVSGNVLYQITVASDNGTSQNIIATAKFTVAVMKNIYVPIYRLLASQPPDWLSNYKSYFRLVNNRYQAVSDDSCPSFTDNAYYYLVNPNYDSKDDYESFHESLAHLENLIGRASDILISLSDKADKSDTLAGYGIEDAYTKTEFDESYTARTKNLNTSAMEKGGIVERTGADNNAADNYIRTAEYVAVEPSTSYVLSATQKCLTNIFGYTSEGKFIDIISSSTTSKNISFTTPDDCTQIKWRTQSTDTTIKFQLEVGDTATDFVPNKIIALHNYNFTDEIVEFLKNKIDGIKNAIDFGVDNTGKDTTISQLFENLTSNSVVYFPPGTYSILDRALISGLNNISLIFAEGAVIKNSPNKEAGAYVFKFENCSNITIKNLNVDVNNGDTSAVSFVNTQFINIESSRIEKVGYFASAYSAGLSFTGDCSHAIIDNVEISKVVANTIGTDNYCHAVGIGFVSSDDKYSKNVNIKNCYLHSFRKAKDDNDSDSDSKFSVQGDAIYIIQRPKEPPTESSGEDDFKCNFIIENCVIEQFNCRGIKASARGVNISKCRIDTKGYFNTQPAVDFQFASGSSIRDSYIKSDRSGIAVNYDNDAVVIDNCEIYGNGDPKNVNSGIILNRKLSDEEVYSGQKQSIFISNSTIDEVGYAIATNNENNEAYDYANLSIQNITVGHFTKANAILLDNVRIGNIYFLLISNIAFAYGKTVDEIFTENNRHYGNNVSEYAIINSNVSPVRSTIINIGEVSTIDNKADKATVDTALNGKADKSDTLAGYGIEDAYTKTEVDTAISSKANLADLNTGLKSKQNATYLINTVTNVTDFMAYDQTDMVYTGKMSGFSTAFGETSDDVVKSFRMWFVLVGENNPIWCRIILFDDGTIWTTQTQTNPKFHQVSYSKHQIDKLLAEKVTTDEVKEIIVDNSDSLGGKSAYEIAVENGFAGTETEWLSSLKGEQGDNYTLTDSDKTEIINTIKTEYDSELLSILGGETNATS